MTIFSEYVTGPKYEQLHNLIYRLLINNTFDTIMVPPSSTHDIAIFRCFTPLRTLDLTKSGSLISLKS